MQQEAFDPPFGSVYKQVLEGWCDVDEISELDSGADCSEVEARVPVIDLSCLNEELEDIEEWCKREICEAAQEWGCFQVINHGVSSEILEKMRCEQIKAFKKPFQDKLDLDTYRWGTPSATCLRHLAWFEAFHLPLTHLHTTTTTTTTTPFSTTINQYAKITSNLAEKLAEILAEKLGHNLGFFRENCIPSKCYIRMSRYPMCPISPHVFGLMPHTDSDFLTILHQDHIGGLQLLRNGKWLNVNPKQETLIVMIGDLFQAWSNDVYKSVEHRVNANKHFERFSVAYFLCPSNETMIESSCGGSSSTYRSFSFGEFRQQVQDDVKRFGHKVGLSRFTL